MKHTALIAALVCAALPAAAQPPQQWQRFEMPGSGVATYQGNNGWTGSTFQAPGSPLSSGEFTGPHGQHMTCSTFQMPGSPLATTECH